MVSLKNTENGFEYLEVSNSVAYAKIALQGAHLFEYATRGEENYIWLSPTSELQLGKAIRGGIPICWPRFGVLDKSMPAHGFSRTSIFSFIDAKELDEARTEVTLRLNDDAKSHEIWDYKFELDVIFSIGPTLEVEIKTTNLDTKSFLITQALHTYFAISNIDDVRIEGLEGRTYLDTLTNVKTLQKDAITIAQEVDRVYEGVSKDIILKDKCKSVTIHSKGSASAVVWNPWIKKSSTMSGMDPEGYKEFVCIETANAFDDFVMLDAKQSHSLKQYLSGCS